MALSQLYQNEKQSVNRNYHQLRNELEMGQTLVKVHTSQKKESYVSCRPQLLMRTHEELLVYKLDLFL